MDESKIPLGMKEIDDFLVSLDRKKCPWCDGHHWGLHIDTSKEPVEPGLRALPSGRVFYGDTGGLKGTITTGVDSSLFLIAAECRECGYVYLFNYFTIRNLMIAKKEEAASHGDSPRV